MDCIDLSTEVNPAGAAGMEALIAQHRGSQAPMVEPLVVLEKFMKQLQEFDFQRFNFSDAVATDLPLAVSS